MKIAVYCSAKDAIPDEYLSLGDQLGAWLGANGHALVYGGATGGLMTRTSEAAKAAGAYVIGIIPPRIKAAGRLATHCDELIEVANMSERKQKMREFLKNACELQGEELEDWLEDILCSLRVETDLTPENVLYGAMGCFQFQKDLLRRLYMYSDEFAQCVGELHEHMRRPYINGYTLAELRKMQAVTGIEVEPETDFSEYELVPERKTKIGRNDPCPCGSGKKYKKCCGRGK